MKAILPVFALAAATLFSNCTKNMKCKDNNSACEKTVLLNKELYAKTSTDNYMITDAKINGDCLEVKFSASGCNSQTWIVDLVDAELITDPVIPQRSLKLALTNNEMCTAAFTKSASFDLTPLRIKGSFKINLLLTGLNKTLLYEYQ